MILDERATVYLIAVLVLVTILVVAMLFLGPPDPPKPTDPYGNLKITLKERAEAIAKENRDAAKRN